MIRSDDGVALTVAIFTMAVIALFSAVVAATAVQLGDASDRDRDEKRALGAAEAGVNTALHRVNNWGSLQNLECFTDVAAAVQADTAVYDVGGIPVETGPGDCPPGEGRAGNGGSWAYWITLLNNGQHCDEQYSTQTEVDDLLSLSVGGISVLRRCITSMGVVNGVSRRVQREIYSEFRLFYGLTATGPITARGPAGGLLGADLATSHVGSNDLVTMEHDTLYGGQVEIHEDAPDPIIDATGQWGVTHRQEPWILDPVDVTLQGGTAGLSCTFPLLLCPGAMWDGAAGNRKLKVDTGEIVTMAAGTYYLCGLRLNGGTLQVLGTARVFIDGDCPNGSPGFRFTGGQLNATGLATPQNLQVFVEQTDPITISGGLLGAANLSLYAPDADVTVQRGTGLLMAVKGSISASSIELGHDTTFVGDPLLDVTTPVAQIAGKWHAGQWSECRSQPTVDGDPHSGCLG